MRFTKKLLIMLVAVVVLGGGFYFVFERPWESEAKKNPLLDLVFGDEESGEGGIISGSKKYIDEKISSVKESVGRSIEEKQEEALDSLKDKTNEAIDAAQEKIIGVGGASGSIKVTPVAKIGEQAYFLLSNPTPAEEVGYEVDWGDGETESGILSGESKTVSHSWAEGGEYSVIFQILGSETSEKVLVVVTE
jgi:preprotein translocase subunit YajC